MAGDRDEVRVEAVESTDAASFSGAVGGGDTDSDEREEVERSGETPFCKPLNRCRESMERTRTDAAVE